MRRANCGRTHLRRRWRNVDPMAAYDALPPAARRWLAGAALPWSACSVRRLWRHALDEAAGDAEAAALILARVEARRLAADTRHVWGADHPGAAPRG